ncbi:MAG: DUF4340 domain-containing protein [Cyclobacteriaceae bacterium]|nr:DUF4340 domain-containing protein [Cyclobacteriaceae bacterium]
MKSISNFKLVVLLILLALIYAALQLFGGKSRSKNYRAELVKIDTAKVSALKIVKEGKLVDLKRASGKWQVKLENENWADANPRAINGALATLMRIKPTRMVTRDPARWKEYDADTSGVEVQVMEGRKKSLDLIIGRFGVRDQQNFFTYVRLQNDNEVYAADNFMGISFNTKINDFRDQTFLSFNRELVNSVEFQYPGDSSFSLIRKGDQWYSGDMPADSASVAEYLNVVDYLNSQDFDDTFSESSAQGTFYQLKFREDGTEKIIKAYKTDSSENSWILQSSQSPAAWFRSDDLAGKIFKRSKDFINA